MSKPSELRRTPLYDCHLEAGARMVEFGGWEMPVQYTGLVEEHQAVRQAAGLFDVSHMGEIHVNGTGAEAFLQWLTPNNVSQLVPGRAHYSGLLTEEGTYLDDVLVYRLGEAHFLLVVNAANIEADLNWIRSHARAGVEVEDRSDETALIALQGPKAETILGRLATLALKEVQYYGFVEGEVAEIPTLVSRTGYTGEDGFELYTQRQAAAGLWRRLMEEGAGLGLKAAGLGARDTLRMEAGMMLHGQDIDKSTTPLEVGLGWVVKFKKGEFVGRDALLAQRDEGVGRKLVGIEVTGRGIARHGYRVAATGHGGGRGGVVTSGTWSPTLGKPLGMAMVPSAVSSPGTELRVEIRGKWVDAVVVALPFYRRAR